MRHWSGCDEGTDASALCRGMDAAQPGLVACHGHACGRPCRVPLRVVAGHPGVAHRRGLRRPALAAACGGVAPRVAPAAVVGAPVRLRCPGRDVVGRLCRHGHLRDAGQWRDHHAPGTARGPGHRDGLGCRHRGASHRGDREGLRGRRRAARERAAAAHADGWRAPGRLCGAGLHPHRGRAVFDERRQLELRGEPVGLHAGDLLCAHHPLRHGVARAHVGVRGRRPGISGGGPGPGWHPPAPGVAGPRPHRPGLRAALHLELSAAHLGALRLPGGGAAPGLVGTVGRASRGASLVPGDPARAGGTRGDRTVLARHGGTQLGGSAPLSQVRGGLLRAGLPAASAIGRGATE